MYEQISRFHFQESKKIFKKREKVIDEFIKESSYKLDEDI